MQVVLLRQVLGVEEVADVVRRPVRVALLRDVRGVLGDREVLQGAQVLEIVVGVPMTGIIGRFDDTQAEEQVEDPVEGLLVTPVLDQADPQRGAGDLPVGQDAGLRARPHRVERLGDPDPDPLAP